MDENFSSIGTRFYFARDMIYKVNGTVVLADIITSAVDPRVFMGTVFVLEDVVTLLNQYLAYDGYELIKEGLFFKPRRIGISESGNKIKNIIFGANGPKPEIILKDATTNDIQVVRNSEYCLIYDLEISADGLLWKNLLDWWRDREKLSESPRTEQAKLLYDRLKQSLQNNRAELLLFHAYYKTFIPRYQELLPALVPQVYLHYDPYTLQQLKGKKRLSRQRMDFLMLLPNNQKVVIEIDGIQHYSIDGKAKPAIYAEMVEEDRKLKLAGYNLFRFGTAEFENEEIAFTKLIAFFEQIFLFFKVFP
jgi:very-short-patch-repair endonuclease